MARTVCPENTLEFGFVQSRAVRTNIKTGDQLFTAISSFVLCLDANRPDFAFTFTAKGTFIGGTGKYAGATGTSEAHGEGRYHVATATGGVFAGLASFTYTETGTITLSNGE
jgi:hypothetical protein